MSSMILSCDPFTGAFQDQALVSGSCGHPSKNCDHHHWPVEQDISFLGQFEWLMRKVLVDKVVLTDSVGVSELTCKPNRSVTIF